MKMQKATFAGGCFWCMEPPFDKQAGIISTLVGYTGGFKKNPTYREVCSEITGHAEAIEISFDSTMISYSEPLGVFWRNIDPTALNRQFVDVGSQYRTAIFYHNEKQRKLSEASKKKLDASGRFEQEIVTEIVPVMEFYQAESYHQSYYQKNPVQYHYYRAGSGRDQFLKKIWGN